MVLVYNVYVKDKVRCRNMLNCIETPSGAIFLYADTLFNVLQASETSLPPEILNSALPVYVRQIHEKCLEDWQEGKAYVICEALPEGGEVCLCLSEWYWLAHKVK